MATYKELRDLFNDSDIKNKVEVATIIYAQSLASGTPTAAQKAWVSSVLQSSATEAGKITLGVLAANSGFTVAQIQGASDAAIQGQVDAIAPILIDALAGV